MLGPPSGGQGRVNCRLPALRPAFPTPVDAATPWVKGGGGRSHTPSPAELPAHTHAVHASSAEGDSVVPTGNLLASPLNQTYRAPGQGPTTLDPGSIPAVGGSQAHLNLEPFLTLSFCIALQGIFPSAT